MASLIIISWRDIPAQVIVKRGRETAKVQLSQRFQEAVDRAAMRAGRGSSDAYLADWARSAPRPCGDDLQAEANAEAARLEARFSDEDLERLIALGSRCNTVPPTPEPYRPSPADVLGGCGRSAARVANAFIGFEALLVRLHLMFQAWATSELSGGASVRKRSRDRRPPYAVNALSSTEHRPMNCPTACAMTARGVNGNCEVKPDMRCVLVEATRGQISRRNRGMAQVQFPVDQRQQGCSSWLHAAGRPTSAASKVRQGSSR